VLFRSQAGKEKGKETKKEDTNVKCGVGVDVGTSNVVVTRQTEDGTFINRYHRNMLYPLEISDESTDLLERSNYLYIKVNDFYYIVGEDALRLVNAVGKGEVIRPMKNGILNASLKESSELLFYVIKAVVGDPIMKNEPLRFSCPANPVDVDIDNTFHKMILQSFFTKMGYDPKPVNEAMAIVYDCDPKMKLDNEEIPLTGISVSAGAGQFNIALSFKGLSLSEFSCTKAGDNLDEQVSKATGVPIGKVIKIKEKQLNLDKVDMSDRVQAALSIYYDEMLNRMVYYMAKSFKDKGNEMEGEIEIVVAGGTSQCPGYISHFETAIKKANLPFKIYRIRHSSTPFYSVSQGCCIRSRADLVRLNKK
jgi:actin-like ATPase involved in cell morphogenesis